MSEHRSRDLRSVPATHREANHTDYRHTPRASLRSEWGQNMPVSPVGAPWEINKM